jgi:hypothetical protein
MAAFERTRPVETLQPPYHLYHREGEDTVLPYTRAHDIGTLVFSPLGSGLLTGRRTPDTTFEESDWRSQASAFCGDTFRLNLEVVERLKGLAADKGCEATQLAIAWVIAPGRRRCRHHRNAVEPQHRAFGRRRRGPPGPEDLKAVEEITAGASRSSAPVPTASPDTTSVSYVAPSPRRGLDRRRPAREGGVRDLCPKSGRRSQRRAETANLRALA